MEINSRIPLVRASFVSLDNVCKSGNISMKRKLKIFNAFNVFSTLVYERETWTLKKTDIDTLQGFQIKRYRRILKIGWNERVRNNRRSEEVCA